MRGNRYPEFKIRRIFGSLEFLVNVLFVEININNNIKIEYHLNFLKSDYLGLPGDAEYFQIHISQKQIIRCLLALHILANTCFCFHV